MAVEKQRGIAAYVNTVIAIYVSPPGTPERPSRQARHLARELYGRGLSLPSVRAAFLLAAARRKFRSADAEQLSPVQTLYHFLPAIEEVTDQPPDPTYVDYLARKLQPFMKPGGVQLDSG